MHLIMIIGLGPGDIRHLTAAARMALGLCRERLYFRTVHHPVARACLERGMCLRSLDRLTGPPVGPAPAARAAGRVLLSVAARCSPVGYAVPGNPLGGDPTVEYLRRRARRRGIRVIVVPGVGPAPGSKGPLHRLKRIMTLLRSTRGCPWDRRQTHLSLRGCLIEEAFEVVAAIEGGDPAALEEELGDLLLQVVFHSEIAREEGRFDLEAVIRGISEKLIRRHPHVFGPGRAATVTQALGRWERAKELEHGSAGAGSIRVDPGLPALLRAYKIQQRASGLGFDWPALEGAVEKLREEAVELQDAYRQGIPDRIEEEFGDFLFAAVNVARFMNLNPELALGKASCKFLDRFAHLQARVAEGDQPFGAAGSLVGRGEKKGNK